MSRIRVVQLTFDDASTFVKFADGGEEELPAASVLGSGHRLWAAAELQVLRNAVQNGRDGLEPVGDLGLVLDLNRKGECSKEM